MTICFQKHNLKYYRILSVLQLTPVTIMAPGTISIQAETQPGTSGSGAGSSGPGCLMSAMPDRDKNVVTGKIMAQCKKYKWFHGQE